MAEQDRSAWHRDEILAGRALVTGLSPARGYAEQLRLQALIAAEHVRAPAASATDWATIAGLYAKLETLTGSPIVRLNRAVAVAEVEGARAGLALLVAVDGVLADHHRLGAVRAELARRVGDTDLARASYQRALELCSNEVERRHLRERLGTLEAPD